MRQALVNRLKAALDHDPFIICKPEQLDKHPGRPLEYLEALGLTKADLLRLERLRLAFRGRVWDTPDGRWMPRGHGPPAKFSGGHTVRWVLIDIGGVK